VFDVFFGGIMFHWLTTAHLGRRCPDGGFLAVGWWQSLLSYLSFVAGRGRRYQWIFGELGFCFGVFELLLLLA
jgi:hypothetical protein